jgi:hypothetical protein
MKITFEAIELFYRMFFSCYMTGKASSENNRKVIEKNLAKKNTMNFAEFCQDLQEWEDRAQAIECVAKKLKKEEIDKDVIINYFGGKEHTEVVLGDLAKEQVPIGGKFYNYTIFNHMLVPLVIKRVGVNENIMIGQYENKNISLQVNGVLFFEKDRSDMVVGKTVLCHYPLVVDANPDAKTIKMVFDLQRKDFNFMQSIKTFPGKVNHTDFPFLLMIKRRM